MNYFTKDDFKSEWLGQSSSLGGYRNQCVTLFKEFLKKAGYPNPGRAIGGSGGAREIWYRREALGYSAYFNFEQIGHPGDWFVWDSVYGWYNGVYYGHVAMLIKDNGNGTGQFLGMNQGTNLSPANIQTLSYNGSCGVLHFKGYSHPTSSSAITVYNPSNLVSEHAVATLTVDSVAIREGSPTGNVLKRVNKGYQFEYYYKCVANGHRWVVNKDKTQFMAISGSEVQGKDLWATFSTVEEGSESTKPSDTIELEQEDGVATFTVDGVRARYDSPSGEVCKTYNSGDSVRYYWKYIGNGHRYVAYKDGDRKVFVAVSATEDRSQMWATFEVPKEDKKEESTPTPQPTTKPTESMPTENTNGFSSVNEGEYEGHDTKDEIYDHDGVTVDLIEKTLYPYKCPYLNKPQAIIIHNAATPNGTAKALNNALHNSKEYKSWHFSVDNKDVIESLPLNRNAFATGDGAYGLGNRTGIHIEIAKDNDNDSKEEWLKARDNGAKLAAELLHDYGWGIDNLKKHQDYKMTDGSYKYCPHKILDEGWDDFKFLVAQYLDQLNNPRKDDSKEDKKDENGSESKKDDSTDKEQINVNGINKIIEMILKIVEKIFKLFK